MSWQGSWLGAWEGGWLGSIAPPGPAADPPPNATRSPRLAVSVACAPAPRVLALHGSVHVHIVKVTHG